MTHYETLQVHPKASAEVIKASYQALTIANHPDRAKSLKDGVARTAKCQELSEAYQVLRDPVRRRAYDQSLAAAKPRKPKVMTPRQDPQPQPYRQPYEDPRMARGLDILNEELECFVQSASERLIEHMFRGMRRD